MSFWGRDGHGQWSRDSAGLGHLLLRVTPESSYERQPTSIRGVPHLVIAADARIDNRDELFDALGVPRAGRGQTPDSSLILLAYERWGDDCACRLLGDFSFAIWNTREQTLYCARDPFGCRPFAYRYDGAQFVFASDIKGVLAGSAPRKLNEPLLAAYLQMRTYHAEKTLTFFEGIVKLPPGHLLKLTESALQVTRYWKPENAPETRLSSPDDYAENLRLLLQESVKCRLRSAFPVGSHLSGGLDSSAVSILAARGLRDDGSALTAFSWSPPPEPGASLKPGSEYNRIEAVCNQEQLICRYVPATVETFFRSFRCDITVEPTALLAHEADVQNLAEAGGLRVILSGWGGDDAVSVGATNYFAEYLLKHQWPELRKVIRTHLGTAAGPTQKARRLAGILYSLVVPRLPDPLYSLTSRNTYLRYRGTCIDPAFEKRYRAQFGELRGPAWRKIAGIREQMCQRLDLGYITMRLEHWATSGARHGLEYRYPMLDKRLVEYVLGIPTAQLGAPGRNRALFRRAMRGVLPENADWGSAKIESSGLAAFREEHFKAHSEWALHVVSDLTSSPARRFVDPERMLAVLRSHSANSKLADLAGLRAAFGCFAIKYW
jgi:asparagine synthase (glutamine-hydrolysing)